MVNKKQFMITVLFSSRFYLYNPLSTVSAEVTDIWNVRLVKHQGSHV